MIKPYKTQPWILSEKALVYIFHSEPILGPPGPGPRSARSRDRSVGIDLGTSADSAKNSNFSYTFLSYTFIVLFFGAWECEWAWYSPDSIWKGFYHMTHMYESYWMMHTLKCRKMVPVIPTSSLVAAAGVWVFLLLKSWVRWCIKTKKCLLPVKII